MLGRVNALIMGRIGDRSRESRLSTRMPCIAVNLSRKTALQVDHHFLVLLDTGKERLVKNFWMKRFLGSFSKREKDST